MAGTLAVGHWQLPSGWLRRGLAAGTAWGIAFGFGLAAFKFWQCGIVCPDHAAVTTAIAVIAGNFTIGPLAAFGARRT
jgi:hypothetical protein